MAACRCMMGAMGLKERFLMTLLEVDNGQMQHDF
jgi:hypothetical protein